MKKNQILYVIAALTIFVSCKKDDAKPDAAGINGTYKFNGMHAKTNSTVTSDDGEKMVTLAEWTSTDNKGTIVFNDPELTNTGFSYSVNSKATGYYYENNILIDSFSAPLVITIPTTQAVSSYQLIGKDSIYFPKGGIMTMGTSTMTSYPGGGHYKLNGNQLTIDLSVTKDSTFTESGVKYQMKETGMSSIILIKQ